MPEWWAPSPEGMAWFQMKGAKLKSGRWQPVTYIAQMTIHQPP